MAACDSCRRSRKTLARELGLRVSIDCSDLVWVVMLVVSLTH